MENKSIISWISKAVFLPCKLIFVALSNSLPIIFTILKKTGYYSISQFFLLYHYHFSGHTKILRTGVSSFCIIITILGTVVTGRFLFNTSNQTFDKDTRIRIVNDDGSETVLKPSSHEEFNDMVKKYNINLTPIGTNDGVDEVVVVYKNPNLLTKYHEVHI